MCCLCGGAPGRQGVSVHLVGCLAVKRPVRSGLVVKCRGALQALVRGADGLIGLQVDLLVFEAFPQPLNKHGITSAPFPIHADLDPKGFQSPRELLAGELAALIGVENLWRALAGQGLLHRIKTEIGRQRVGPPPRQHTTTRLVQHGTHIAKAARHRKVGNVPTHDSGA